MPRGRSEVIFKDLHALFRVGTAGGLTDGELLGRFLDKRDDAGEAAFKALVERQFKMMFRMKLKSIVAGVLAIGVLTVGIGLLAISMAGAPPQDGRADETAKKAPVSREGRSSSGPLICKTSGKKGSRGWLPSTPRRGNGGRSTRGSR